MYIPTTNYPSRIFPLAQATSLGADQATAHGITNYGNSRLSVESISCSAHQLFSRSLSALSTALDHTSSLVRKRASGDNVNTTIGVVVGILLAAFLIGLFAFLHVYRKSIRFTKKRRHRRKSSGSKGSKNSEGAGAGAGGGGGGDPPAPA
ncbi:hypothetical protein GGR54DRAFT_387989 [Hypoxylon sp. NC1633]|nr:hypothetical protein GGR54DRAFT_387989 [Hypoxylon sp. NC1633]